MYFITQGGVCQQFFADFLILFSFYIFSRRKVRLFVF